MPATEPPDPDGGSRRLRPRVLPSSIRLAAALLAGGLLGSAVLGAAVLPAQAADFEGYRGGPPPYAFDRGPPPPPPYGPPPPRYVMEPPAPPPCRTIVRRHFDPYGDEVIRRVRVCDGPPGGFGPPPPWRGPRW